MLLAIIGTASAGYLFGLSQSDIDDVASYYDIDDQTDLEIGATAPFGCFRYGDLCDLVGPAQAEDWLEGMWTLLLAHEDEETIDIALQGDLDAMEEDWVDFLFPSGIPASSPWWGPETSENPPPFSECDGAWDDDDGSTPKKARETWTTGSTDYRLTSRSWWVHTGAYNAQGTTSRTHKKATSASNYSKWTVAQITWSNLSHRDSACGAICDSKSKTSYKAKNTVWWAIGAHPTYSYINGVAEVSSVGRTIASDNTDPFGATSCP